MRCPLLCFIIGEEKTLETGETKLPEPQIQDTDQVALTPPEATVEKKSGNGFVSIAVTAGIIISGLIIVGIFKDEINGFGADIMRRYGQTQVDIILYFITAISASPLVLPIWQYVMIGVAMGYSIVRLSIVMALGSATGSVITYYIGRYFGNSKFITKKFPKAHNHPWVEGRSKWFVTGALFLGTASPIPFDILYFACGIKRYPVGLLFVACVAGRIIRYLYLGYGFGFFSRWM